MKPDCPHVCAGGAEWTDAMAVYTFFGYRNNAFIRDFSTNTLILRPDFDPELHRFKIVITEDDADTLLDGDQFRDEIGDDATQDAVVTTPSGAPFRTGQVYSEQANFYLGSDGSNIRMDQIEIAGTQIGFLVNEPLTPGVTYTFRGSRDVVSSPTSNRTDYADIQSVPCFTAGTEILAEYGPADISALAVGDLVVTRDRGLQPIRWIGRTMIPIGDAALPPSLRPVKIAVGALGSGIPESPLVVSPQHRVLLSGAICEMLFTESEVFAAAKHLVAGASVSWASPSESFEYIHLLLDNHEIIKANGAWVDSLFLGSESYQMMSLTDRLAASAALSSFEGHRQTARPSLKSWEARLVVQTAAGLKLPLAA